MRGLLALTSFLILVGSLACQAPETPAPAPRSGSQASSLEGASPAGETEQGPLVVFLGDSLTAGLGVPEQKAFPALLEESLRAEIGAVRVINAGVSGDTSAGGLSRLSWLLRQEPDLLVVELGGNDALRGQPLKGIEENLRELIRVAQERRVRVLLLGMQAPPSYGAAYATGFAEIYPRLARDLGVAFVPSFLKPVGGRPSLNLSDGIHPTEEGHALLAAEILPHLQPMVHALLEEKRTEKTE